MELALNLDEQCGYTERVPLSGKIVVGVIGLGYWGANYLRVFSESKLTSIKYVCDKDTRRFPNHGKLSKGLILTDDPMRIVEDEAVQAVVIATPASTHYDIAKSVLKAKKHVLIEKPMTLSYSQAMELGDIGDRANSIVMVGHIYCYNPSVEYMKDQLQKKNLGELYYGTGLRMGIGPIRSDASCTWDLATHDLAMLDYLLGETPISVSADARSFLQRDKRIYDQATIYLKYAGGFTFSLMVSWYAAEKIRKWFLVGTQGMLTFDDMIRDQPITVYERSTETSSSPGNALVIKDGKEIRPRISGVEPLSHEVSQFLYSIKNNRKPVADARQGARVVRVVEAVETSIKKGGSSVKLT